MLVYAVRRAVASTLLVLVSTAVMYVLVALSGNPLRDLLAYNGPGRTERLEARTAALNLDVPVPGRYLLWLQDVARCAVPGGDGCTLGLDRQGRPVLPQLELALGSTLRLVVAATVLSLVLGVVAGIVTALRQYSALDHTVTLVALMCFSLPVFWVSTLLKQYVAIDLNTWLGEPRLTVASIAGVGAAAGLAWALVVGGDARRRLVVAGLAGTATAGTLAALLASGWFVRPALGVAGIAASGLVAAFGWTALLAGLGPRSRRTLAAGAAAAVAGTAVVAAAGPVLGAATWAGLAALAAATIALAVGAAWCAGGAGRRRAALIGGLTGACVAAAAAVDQLLRAYPALFRSTGGRPIATTGSQTPNLGGGFWETNLDVLTHLALPTLAIMAISFASYARFTRSSLLDVLTQDHVRTARAAGLDERTVVLRHALRTALLPLATLVAFDLAAVFGGAVVAETVFGWNGMGRMFTTALTAVDPNPVMAFFLVTAVATAAFNLCADLAYASLDPRIVLR
ncbi:ABC transporter permease [Pengzhenrongella sicca]|uniref:ABC transporter permease n=1 Tax=Pengzhenrongella sicca TaxID=2819238 RepID=A0A8A4ZA56_9MICO|nr:ABC transporter permease [Pengzhenrongella sicca]QTE28830.1 ABC transporter permease [Pengzhenrongella sicca]